MISINNITDKAVIFYLYAIVPASLLTGFLLRSGLTVAGLTPSLALSVFILTVLSLFFAIQGIEKKNMHKYILACIFMFLVMPVGYLMIYGFKYLTEEYNQSLTITASIFLIVYISYYSNITSHKLYNILNVINITLIANIVLCWILDIGYPSYISSGREIGTKGFLYGGNTASLLSIAVLCFYLFNDNFNLYWKWALTALAFLAAILTQTISSIVAPVILIGYLIIKSKYRYPLLILAIIAIALSSAQIYQITESYLDSNYRFQRISNIDSYSTEYRRFYDSYLQLEYQMDNPITIITGAGRAGQLSFWDRDLFNFSGMDISDLFMKYGLVGISLLSVVFVFPIFKYLYVSKIDSISVSSMYILLYGIFGGYLFTSITALMYLSILTSLGKIRLDRKQIKI